MTVVGAILGVLFYEAVRIYRCFRLETSALPDVGFPRKINFIIYLVVIGIFVTVAFFISYFAFESSAIKAFFVGFSIPTGAHLLNPNINQHNSDIVDDMASEEFGLEAKIAERLKGWYDQYFI